jgi:hypothetical protein
MPKRIFPKKPSPSAQYDEKKLLNDIVQKSISRSPYIAGFELTDWRTLFSEIIERFKEETWWRDQDYPGNPRFKYDKFIK